MNKIKPAKSRPSRLMETVIPFDDTLYDAIVGQVSDCLHEAIIDYENNPYDYDLYDTIDVKCNVNQHVGNGQAVFGTVFAWFKHWYDFVEAVGIKSCKMFVCGIRDDKTMDLDNAQPIDIGANVLDRRLQDVCDIPNDGEDDGVPVCTF
ncbi:MAG: hypothetical protein LUD72_07880 [Bacteroidales bacterium]|nr:hypothetical protein [Bacteroidales bacterium]